MEDTQNKKSIAPVVIGLVLVLGVGGYFLFRSRSPDTEPQDTPTPTATATLPLVTRTPTVSPTATATGTPKPTGTVDQGAGVKVFTVTGQSFSFAPSEIRVKKGDVVKIIFKNTESLHDWVVDEFNARTPKITGGQTAEIQFVASKAGTFEYYCSVGTHRQQGMRGNLIVE